MTTEENLRVNYQPRRAQHTPRLTKHEWLLTILFTEAGIIGSLMGVILVELTT